MKVVSLARRANNRVQRDVIANWWFAAAGRLTRSCLLHNPVSPRRAPPFSAPDVGWHRGAPRSGRQLIHHPLVDRTEAACGRYRALGERESRRGSWHLLSHRLLLLITVPRLPGEGALVLAHGIVEASKGFEVRVSG